MTSILVRKHCQPVLDEAGYPMLFATVQDSRYDPSLVIYTTCGKPFVEVHGVKFSRRAPTIAESEYSAVLLQQWMERHKDDFEEYVDAYTEYYSTEAPERKVEVDHNTLIKIDEDGTMIRRTYTRTDSKGKEHRYYVIHQLDTKGDGIHQFRWEPEFPLTLAELTQKIKVPKSLLTKAQKLRDENRKYWDLRERFDKAREKVRTCQI